MGIDRNNVSSYIPLTVTQPPGTSDKPEKHGQHHRGSELFRRVQKETIGTIDGGGTIRGHTERRAHTNEATINAE